MDYLHETAVAIYHRRRRQRTVVTLTFVSVLLLVTVGYATSYVRWDTITADKSVASASCPKDAAFKAVKPSDVTVNVYNTTAHAGLASSAARSLGSQGFIIGAVDNDPLGKTVPSQGEIRHGEGGAAGAILTAARLPGATLVLDGRMGPSVDLVLGRAYRTLSVPGKVSLTNTAKLISTLTSKPSHCLGVHGLIATTAAPARLPYPRTQSGSAYVRIHP